MSLVVINPTTNFFTVLECVGCVVTSVRLAPFEFDFGVLHLTAHNLDVPTYKHRLDLSISIIKSNPAIPNFKHPVTHGAFAAQDIKRLLSKVVRPRPDQFERVDPHIGALSSDRQRRGGARGGEAYRVGDPISALRDSFGQADRALDTIGDHTAKQVLGVISVGAGNETNSVVLASRSGQIAPDGTPLT